MKVSLVAVGRLKAGPERELFQRYLDRAERAGQPLGLNFDLTEVAESGARRADARKESEAAALRQALPRGSVIAALDEKGTSLDSRAIAERLSGWRDSGNRAVAFVIGGADGLSPEIVATAELRLAFGRATWPHQLVRIMLAEQLYRAVTILSGHPYHRA